MSTVNAIESLQSTLEPLQELQGEQTQLEAWVNESFKALESLHGELAEWQSVLARKQTELDMREDNLENFSQDNSHLEEKVTEWESELAQAREEIGQLEEENAEQLQELESLENRHASLESELEKARENVEELTATLDEERSRVVDGQHDWKDEFEQIRYLLNQQFEFLSHRLGESASIHADEESSPVKDQESSSRSAELRRRAESRRAKRRQQLSSEDQSES